LPGKKAKRLSILDGLFAFLLCKKLNGVCKMLWG